MKKIILLLLMFSMFCGIKVCANITPAGASNAGTEQQLSNNLSSELNKFISPEDIAKSFMTGYFSYLRECKPYDINFGFNVIDLGLQSKLKVDGWVNDRCVYSASAKLTHMSDNVKSMLGVNIPDEELSTIEPVFQCKFSKTQLNKIVDIMEEESLSQDSKNISPSQQQALEKKHAGEILKILSSSGTCSFLNSNEIMKKFMSK